MISFIVVLVIVFIELIIVLLSLKKKNHRERLTCQNLYKLLEVRVLNRNLQNRISTEAAAQYEWQQMFVRLEFLDARPWLAYLYATDECITIGRSRENMVFIRDDLLSRMHCKIVAQNNVLYLQDMGTTNGTILKKGLFSKTVLASQEIKVLNSGDIIYVGHYRIRVKIYYGSQAYK